MTCESDLKIMKYKSPINISTVGFELASIASKAC